MDLTPRQKEIVIMISKGKTTKEMARELQLSPHTVATYRLAIARILGFAGKGQLGPHVTRYAIENNLQ